MTDASHTFTAPGASSSSHADDDLRPMGPGEGSLLDDLRAELTADLDEEMDPLEVPERPAFAVVYSKAIDNTELKAWRRRARDGKDVDELRLACIILGNQCRRIIRRTTGAAITAGDGEPVTFRDAAFHELYGVGRAADAIRRFYGLDGHVLAAASAVVTAAGYGAALDDAEDELEDPTPAS